MTIQELENYKIQIIKIVEIFFPKAKVYLFGSFARGDTTTRSDIDLAIDIGERMSLVNKAQIRNMIEALNIPQNIDLVDFNAIPFELKENILKEGIVWKIV